MLAIDVGRRRARRRRSSHRPPDAPHRSSRTQAAARRAAPQSTAPPACLLGSTPEKSGCRPDRRKIDAAVVKAIGIDQPRDQAKRQVVAVDRMGGKQRPAGLELDGPEAVEFERGLRRSANGASGNCAATWKLSGARGCPDVAGSGISQSHENASAIDRDVAGQQDHHAIGHGVDKGRALLDGADVAAVNFRMRFRRHRPQPVRQARCAPEPAAADDPTVPDRNERSCASESPCRSMAGAVRSSHRDASLRARSG